MTELRLILIFLKPIYLFFKLFEPKSHLKDKSESKQSNVNIKNINTIIYPLNYAYLNNKLLNFNNLSADFHDNALFNNIALVKHNEQFSIYAQYMIQNLDQASKSKDLSLKIIILNPWLRSILEVIHQVKLVNALNSQECSLSDFDEKYCSNLEEIVTNKNLFSTFFLENLNGNFYKFNHLLAFLKDKIEEISLNTNNESEQFLDSLGDLDESSKSLIPLKLIQKFLNLPCTQKLLKIILNQHITFKNLLLFNQCNTSNITSKTSHLKIDNRLVENGSRHKNVNNNDENCVNFNSSR